jgi:hypothetical protein
MLKPQRAFLAIAILAFALRLAYAAATGELRAPQVWETEEIATNLVEHHEFTFHYRHDPLMSRAYIEPMYPFVAAGVYLVTNHSLMTIVLLQLLIAAATGSRTSGGLAAVGHRVFAGRETPLRDVVVHARTLLDCGSRGLPALRRLVSIRDGVSHFLRSERLLRRRTAPARG